MRTRSRIDTRAWITQSSPISTCRPITTCGWTIVRAPMRAPSPITANGPIDTPAPSVTSCADRRRSDARRAAAATGRRRARRRARTPDTDGASAASRTAPLGRLAEDDRRRARRAQLGGVLGVGEEGEIAGRPRPRCRRRRGCRCRRRLRGGTRGARRCLEFQGVREYLTEVGVRARQDAVRRPWEWSTAVRSKKLARCSRRRRSATSWTRCSRAAGSSAIARRSSVSGALPSVRHSHDRQALARAAHREVVADQTEGEVVRDDVRSGDEEEHPGRDEPERVDDQPEAVLLEVALELRPRSTSVARASSMSSG